MVCQIYLKSHAIYSNFFIVAMFFRPKQQAKMAAHCRNILGDLLLTDPLETNLVSRSYMYVILVGHGKWVMLSFYMLNGPY